MTQKELAKILEEKGMRLTRPRLAVAELLLKDGIKRHVSAEWVATQLADKGDDISLASVYNTLNSFVDLGILRQIQAGNASVLFDTNTKEHHHFLVKSTGELIDIDADAFEVSKLPAPPSGYSIKELSVIIEID